MDPILLPLVAAGGAVAASRMSAPARLRRRHDRELARISRDAAIAQARIRLATTEALHELNRVHRQLQVDR